MSDLSITNHGSIVTLRPTSDVGRTWIAAHIPGDAMTWCGSIVVEPRYIGDIAAGAIDDGLVVS